MATVGELAELVQGRIVGNASLAIDDLADLASAGPRHVSFLANPKYLSQAKSSRAGAILVAAPFDGAPCTQVVCDNPYLAMARIALALHPPRTYPPGIAGLAKVVTGAEIDATATLCDGVFVDAGAWVGPRTVLMPGVYIGRGVRVGADCRLHPGVKVLDRCVLGDRVELHAGVVIGADGFGFALDKATGKRHKIPQVGIVQLGNDVEIGANSTVDRATFGVTRIGDGCKIDNLVQVGHNVVMGRDCVVVSQSGIAGSTELGDRVVIGAQGGVAGHLKVADDVMLGARAGVASNIDAAGVYSGTPTMPHKQWLKVALTTATLPEMRRRVRALELRLQHAGDADKPT